MQAEEVLAHIKLVQQTREFIRAIRQFTTVQSSPFVLERLQQFIQGCPLPEYFWSAPDRDLWQCEAEVTALVLKDVDEAEHSEEAEKILWFIKEQVYGSCKQNMQQSLLALVSSQSFRQACEARSLCLATVIAQLSPDNCISLLQCADDCNATILRTFSSMMALKRFAEAWRGSGFCQLSTEQLVELVKDDDLQVHKELEVFWSIAKWIESDLELRECQTAHLLEKGVRLEWMERSALSEIDSHPLVISSKEASAAVAKAYMQACYGAFITGAKQEKRPKRGIKPVECMALSPMSTASCNPLSPDFDPSSTSGVKAYLKGVNAREAENKAGLGSELAASMTAASQTKKAGLEKRKKAPCNLVTPEDAATPTFRFEKLNKDEVSRRMVVLPVIAESAEEKEGDTRRPASKRRLLFLPDA